MSAGEGVAFAGLMIGVFSLLSARWFAHRHGNRRRRRRAQLFIEFIDLASKRQVDALTHNLTDISTIAPLYGLRAKIGIIANSQ